jgi:hypothetical protein
MACEIYIAGTCQGMVSPADLVHPRGSFSFKVENINECKPVRIFHLAAPGFHFEFRIENGNVVFERNGIKAIAQSDPKKVGDWLVIVTWSPTILGACCTFMEPNPIAVPAFVETPRTLAPRALIQHAKTLKLTVSNYFSTSEDFREAAHHVIRDLISDIELSGGHEALWDKAYSGAKRVSMLPKRETDIHSLIAWHLCDWAELRGVQVVPEAETAVGRLDFALQARIGESGQETFCVEFKHAHARDLAHGLEVQLPAYMDRLRAKYGAYVLLWYQGSEFKRPGRRAINSIAKHWNIADNPASTDKDNLTNTLGLRSSKTDLNCIRVFALDATAPVPASKAKTIGW